MCHHLLSIQLQHSQPTATQFYLYLPPINQHNSHDINYHQSNSDTINYQQPRFTSKSNSTIDSTARHTRIPRLIISPNNYEFMTMLKARLKVLNDTQQIWIRREHTVHDAIDAYLNAKFIRKTLLMHQQCHVSHQSIAVYTC